MGKKAAPAVVASPEPQDDQKKEEPAFELLKGEFQFPDSSTYSGFYKKVNDEVCLHGQGALQTGPESFSGTFENGCYKKGTYTKTQLGGKNVVYSGSFHENQYHGFGEYQWPDGRSFKGMWKKGVMHGRGVFSNFSFGVDREYTGFAIEGKFSSNREEQMQMRKKFVTKYSMEFTKSASSSLKELAGGMGSDFFVPVQPTDAAITGAAEEEKPELAAERAAIGQIVSGPFPEKDSVQQSLLQAFVTRLDESHEKPLSLIVYEEMSQPNARLDVRRLKHEQLQYAGQCVEFSAAEADPGQLCAVVLANVVSDEYDVEKARWKLIHIEEVPQPSS